MNARPRSLCVLLCGALAAGCGKDSTAPAPVPAVTAVATVEVGRPAETLVPGASVTLSVTLRSASGEVLTGRPVTWASSDTLVARVDAAGVLTARAPGAALITATAGGKSGGQSLAIAHPVRSLRLSVTSVALAPGATESVTATSLDGAGAALTGYHATWTTSTPGVATVNVNGQITGMGPGRAVVTARIADAADSVVVTVAALTYLSPDTLSLRPTEGRTVRLMALVYPTPQAITASWTSSDPAVATVDAGGRVTAHRAGEAAITAVGEGGSRTARVFVRNYEGSLVFASVTAGNTHMCGLTTEGAAYCWGSNEQGQLGSETPADRCDRFGPSPTRSGLPLILTAFRCSVRPVPVEGGIRFTSLSAGYDHSCGVAAGGAVYCWGGNRDGALGNGSTARATLPTRVAGSQSFRSVSAGESYTCAVATDGRGYCWGYGFAGKLGTGSAASVSTPTPVVGGIAFASISAVGSTTCGVGLDGWAYCWGHNACSALGSGGDVVPCGVFTFSDQPVRVATIEKIVSVSPAAGFACALTEAGRALCWGNFTGLGTGATSPSSTPVAVSGGYTFTQLDGSISTMCGLERSGRLLCWAGAGATNRLPAERIPGTTLRSVSVEDMHSAGIGTDGVAYTWGYDVFGSLGAASEQGRNALNPERVARQR